MKKVLILSYHFPPLNVVASYRAKAMADYFYENGIHPTIVTHLGNDESFNEYKEENHSNYSVIRIPRAKNFIWKIFNIMENNRLLFKVLIILSYLFGNLDINSKNHSSYLSYKKFLFNPDFLKKYDLIIGIFSPHHHLKLIYKLNKKYKIPYALDFRDLWSNEIVHKNYKPTLTKKLRDKSTMHYWGKWLKNASFFTITNHYWKSKINQFSNTKGYVITNGFESNFKIKTSNKIDNKVFTIGAIGRFYEYQDIDTFLNGVYQFIENNKPEKFKISLLGVPKKCDVFWNKIKLIPNQYLEIFDKTDKEGVVKFLYNTNLVWYPAFNQIEGWCSAKIYDYIAFSNHIIISPGDNGIVDEIITNTNTGIILNSSELVSKKIEEMYKDWLNKIPYENNKISEEVNFYSRKNQIEKYSEIILNHLNNKKESIE